MTTRLLVGVLMALLSTVTPSWAATLESPAQGATLSGLGFISGWKCDAGEITVTINNGGHIPVATEQPRADVRHICGTVHHGFITQMNWALLGDGTHEIAAYDDGVEFARATFTVATLGEEFVRGASGVCQIQDFPAPGETARFAWNESTQHLELTGEEEEQRPVPEPELVLCDALPPDTDTPCQEDDHLQADPTVVALNSSTSGRIDQGKTHGDDNYDTDTFLVEVPRWGGSVTIETTGGLDTAIQIAGPPHPTKGFGLPVNTGGDVDSGNGLNERFVLPISLESGFAPGEYRINVTAVTMGPYILKVHWEDVPDTQSSLCTTKTARVLDSDASYGDPATWSVTNPCNGETLEIAITPLTSEGFFACSTRLEFVQNGVQFDWDFFDWFDTRTRRSVCGDILPGLTKQTTVEVGATLSFSQPFAIYYDGARILAFP